MPSEESQETHDRLTRIEGIASYTAKSMDAIQVRMDARGATLEGHDREIALLKQAADSDRRYQDLKNSGVEVRLGEQAKLWADNDAEHAAMLGAINAVNEAISSLSKTMTEALNVQAKMLAEYRGGGRVIYWILGIVSTIAIGLLMKYIAGH